MSRAHHRLVPVALVSATVILQLVIAWVLSAAARNQPHPGLVLAAGVIAVAIGLNVVRFVIWGYTHRHFPISQTYPLTALFFPCILVLSYIQGDAIGPLEIAGTALITLGAIVMGSRNQPDETHQ